MSVQTQATDINECICVLCIYSERKKKDEAVTDVGKGSGISWEPFPVSIMPVAKQQNTFKT